MHREACQFRLPLLHGRTGLLPCRSIFCPPPFHDMHQRTTRFTHMSLYIKCCPQEVVSISQWRSLPHRHDSMIVKQGTEAVWEDRGGTSAQAPPHTCLGWNICIPLIISGSKVPGINQQIQHKCRETCRCESFPGLKSPTIVPPRTLVFCSNHTPSPYVWSDS